MEKKTVYKGYFSLVCEDLRAFALIQFFLLLMRKEVIDAHKYINARY